MKIAPGDIKALLRQFKIDNADDPDKHIDHMKTSYPLPVSVLIAFRFDKRRYYAIYDETADDDLDHLIQQVKSEASSTTGLFVKNPHAAGDSYGVPFKGKTVYLYAADADKKRLDLVLAERYPDTSRSTWQKHIKAGQVSVNGMVVVSPRSDVSSSDDIQAKLPDMPDFSSHDLPVIFKNADVIVVNKPIGVLTHAKGVQIDEFTAADFFRRFTHVGLDTNRPGIVHRLDRDTSGVLIGALSEDAQTLLGRQFSERKVKKTYVAIVSGVPKQEEAVIDLPIGRNPNAPSTFRVDAKGKSATTHYKVLAVKNGLSLVELKPVTGRTHQLRVHMAHIGTPILGDRIYSKATERLYLHAHKLEITIPGGDRRVFEAPLPPEFNDALNR